MLPAIPLQSHPDVLDESLWARKASRASFAILSSSYSVPPALNRGMWPHLAATSTTQPCQHLHPAEELKARHSAGTSGWGPGEMLTSTASVSCRKRRLTDSRASRGHSWNQSIAVQLTMAGNLLLRTRSLLPTGEKHSATWGAQRKEKLRRHGREQRPSSRHTAQPRLLQPFPKGDPMPAPKGTVTSILEPLHFIPVSLALKRRSLAVNTFFFLCNKNKQWH